jgi:calpain-15
LILEKAWAKVNGNYENTIKGYVSEAFRALTGAPVVFYKHDFVESLWDKMVHADKNWYIICASASKGELNKKEFDKLGLISDHAYSVISLHEVDTPLGVVHLLKLRNPWGHKEWMGDWSDTSDLWTPQLKKQLNVKVEDDGVFFISHQDYMNYFMSTCVCKIHETYGFNHIKTFHDKDEYSLIMITV